MTEQDFDHIDYRNEILNLPKDFQWLVSHLDEQAQDYPDFQNITFTRMLLAAPDCYFQVYRIPKDLATQPVGNLFGGVTVYQTRASINRQEIIRELQQTLEDKQNISNPVMRSSLKDTEEEIDSYRYQELETCLLSHAVKWMFENYEIGRRLPKVNQDD